MGGRALWCGFAVAVGALAVAASGSPASPTWTLTNLVRVARHRSPTYVGVAMVGMTKDGAVYWTAHRERTDGKTLEVFRWQHGRVADLGSPGPSKIVVAVNDRGQFLVQTRWPDVPLSEPYNSGPSAQPKPAPIRAYLWENGKLTNLGTLGGTNAYAAAINDRGQIVGSSDLRRGSSSPVHAFIWQHGKMTDLGTLGGTTSAASGINDRGQVIGSSTLANPERRHGFLWQHGEMTDLGTLGGWTSNPVAVNDRGQVVGTSTTGRHTAHRFQGQAFIWQDGKMTEIGTLDLTGDRIACESNTLIPKCVHPCRHTKPTACTYWRSVPTAVDDRGDVVGMSETDVSEGHAFLWRNGKLTDLGTLGGRSSEALGVDDAGGVVGWSDTRRVPSSPFEAPAPRPFYWRAGTMTELPTAVGEPTLASAIGPRGLQVLGGGEYGQDGNQLLLWRRATS